MAVCNRCRKDSGLFGSYNRQTSRCGKCESEVQQGLARFKATFIQYCGDGVLTDPEWNFLLQLVQRDNISKQEALAFIREDAIKFLERSLVFAASDGEINWQHDINIRHMIAKLEIPPEASQPILNRLTYLKALGAIRMGSLPIVQPSVKLEQGEVCHFEIPATFNQQIAYNTVNPVHGTLMATSRKIMFLSQAGPMIIPLGNVTKVSVQAGGILLELGKNAGNFLFTVQDPDYVEAVIDTVVRMSRQDITQTQRGRDNRHISQEIKTAVWERDKGKCVECGSVNFLEIDHIVPLSAGGTSNLSNLQLLCRNCFQKKSVKTWSNLPTVSRERPSTGSLQPRQTGNLQPPQTGNLQPNPGTAGYPTVGRPGTGNLQPQPGPYPNTGGYPTVGRPATGNYPNTGRPPGTGNFPNTERQPGTGNFPNTGRQGNGNLPSGQ